MAYPNKTNFRVVVCTTNINCLIKQCVITPGNNAQLTRLLTHHGTLKKTHKKKQYQLSKRLTRLAAFYPGDEKCKLLCCKVQSMIGKFCHCRYHTLLQHCK